MQLKHEGRFRIEGYRVFYEFGGKDYQQVVRTARSAEVREAGYDFLDAWEARCMHLAHPL